MTSNRLAVKPEFSWHAASEEDRSAFSSAAAAAAAGKKIVESDEKRASDRAARIYMVLEVSAVDAVG